MPTSRLDEHEEEETRRAHFRCHGTYTVTLKARDKPGLTSLPAKRTFSRWSIVHADGHCGRPFGIASRSERARP